MKVKELIEKLEQCNQDLDVCTCCKDCDIIKDSFEITGIAQITMTEYTDMVVIRHY